METVPCGSVSLIVALCEGKKALRAVPDVIRTGASSPVQKHPMLGDFSHLIGVSVRKGHTEVIE